MLVVIAELMVLMDYGANLVFLAVKVRLEKHLEDLREAEVMLDCLVDVEIMDFLEVEETRVIQLRQLFLTVTKETEDCLEVLEYQDSLDCQDLLENLVHLAYLDGMEIRAYVEHLEKWDVLSLACQDFLVPRVIQVCPVIRVLMELVEGLAGLD